MKRIITKETEAKRQSMIAKGYILTSKGYWLHREVCKQEHGAFPRNWLVHHVDGNISNNKPDNLIAVPPGFISKINRLQNKQNRVLSRAECQSMVRAYCNLPSKRLTDTPEYNKLRDKHAELQNIALAVIRTQDDGGDLASRLEDLRAALGGKQIFPPLVISFKKTF